MSEPTSDDLVRILERVTAFCSGAPRTREEIVSMLTGISNPRAAEDDDEQWSRVELALRSLRALRDRGDLVEHEDEADFWWSTLGPKRTAS